MSCKDCTQAQNKRMEFYNSNIREVITCKLEGDIVPTSMSCGHHEKESLSMRALGILCDSIPHFLTFLAGVMFGYAWHFVQVMGYFLGGV
jgi:hypothetical protein